MKSSIILIVLLLITPQCFSQLEGEVYDDLCMGCCGKKFSFGQGFLYARYMGAFRVDLEGEYFLKSDTLRIIENYDRWWGKLDSPRTSVYIKRDSLSFINVNSQFDIIYLIEKTFEDNYVKRYSYNDSFDLISVTIQDSNKVVRNIKTYSRNTIFEQQFDVEGKLRAEGSWRKGKKQNDWLNFYY